MRVAIVHDYLTQFGGAERVLLSLMKLFPHAPVFTLVHDPNVTKLLAERSEAFDERRLRTSFLQRIPGARAYHRFFPLLMPLAIEQFDVSQYDVVFSATHSFGKGILTNAKTLHVSYCFTPTRYVWDDCHRYVQEFSRSRLFRGLAPLALSYIRLWDYYASQRVHRYVTLSHFVAKRISKYYRREAAVVAPPVAVDRFYAGSDQGYYLIVSRLMPYKRVDLAIEACAVLGRRLIIAGVGPEEEALRRRVSQLPAEQQRLIEFRGFVADDDLPKLYAGARALLFPQEEDFGITPLEAAAAGKPTVAFGSGGAVETIIDGVTGILFSEQSVLSLFEAMRRFEATSFDVSTIQEHAEKYREERFLQEIEDIVQNEWLSYMRDNATR